MKKKRLLTLVLTLTLLFSMSLGTQNVWAGTNGNLAVGQMSVNEEGNQGKLQQGVIDSALFGAKGKVQVIVELADAPSSVIYSQLQSKKVIGNTVLSKDAAKKAVNDQNQKIEDIQKNLATKLTSSEINAKVIYRAKKVYNGIAINVDAEKLDTIKNMPGVIAVHKLVPKYIDNSTTVPFIGGQSAWAKMRETNSNIGLGENIKVGVIDTGIDYMHSDFGGPGGTYTSGNLNYFGTGKKVVGGHDFVGAAYNGGNGAVPVTDPTPDDDPMPDYGGSATEHGTHVAATIAGFGVNADGSTYTGPYDETIPADLQIGPGVAPKASLYALKVFGKEGSTDFVTAALEWAIDPNNDGDFSDHLDVVNMSLGSPYGSVYDADNIAVEKATDAGIVVVASAGNSGDAFYITGSPASSDSAISVSATVGGAFPAMDGFGIGTQASVVDVVYGASNSYMYNWTSLTPKTAQLYYPGENQSGDSAFSDVEKAKIKDKIVLLDWTAGSSSYTKTTNAYNAGAAGVVFAYNKPALDVNINGNTYIPAVITNMETGVVLKQKLSVSDSVYATFDNGYTGKTKQENIYGADVSASFSSMGPRSGDSVLKPDIAAPGVNIYSALAYSGNKGTNLSGTSMAAPVISGCVALLKELHPDWKVTELKALLMNTATHDVKGNPTDSTVTPLAQVSKAGIGRVDVTSAVYSNGFAFNTDKPALVNVSFGPLEISGDNEYFEKSITVVNKGNTPVEYTLSFTDIDTVPGVNYSFPDGNSVSVAANSSTQFRVRITADASQMQHTHNALLDVSGNRSWMSEAAGYITLTPKNAGEKLRLSVYAAPRPASVMNSAQSSINGLVTGTKQLSLAGTSVNTSGTYGEKSKVSILELKDISEELTNLEEHLKYTDIKYTGIASDYKVAGVTDPYLYFGISSWKDWSSPNNVDYEIYIDTNNDGSDDYVLINSCLASGSGNSTDIFVSTLYQKNAYGNYLLQANYYSDIDQTPQFNTNVMILPVPISALNLASGNTKIKYQVKSYIGIDLIDEGEVVSYDFANPGIYSDSTSTTYMTDETSDLSLNFNREAYVNDNSKGILLLHHDNKSGNRDEVVAVELEPNASIAPMTATFNKGAQADVAITLTGNGRTLNKISNQSYDLVPGTDYTVSGDVYSIKSTYLASLENGDATLIFEMSGGINPTAVITVNGTIPVDASVTPVTAAFDKGAQADIAITLTKNGRTLNKINNQSYTLVPDTDYVVSGSTYTIKSAYLASLGNGDATLTFEMSGGVNPTTVITISGTIPGDASLTPVTAAFNKGAQADIAITLTANGRTLNKISNQSYTLVPGTDYVVSGSTYTIKSTYLASLPNGAVTLNFEMSGGANPTFVITVSGTISSGSQPSGGGGYVGGVSSDTTSTVTVTIKTGVSHNEVTGTIASEAKSDSNGNTVASVTESLVKAAINKAAEAAAKQGENAETKVEINITAPADAKSIETVIPKPAITALAESKDNELTITTSAAAISFDKGAINTLSKEATSDVKIKVSKVDTASLSEEAKSVVGDRPVINFGITSGDKTISQFDGTVTVSIPYTLKAGEDTNAIVIYYINAEGKPEIIRNCVYNPATGTITFKTNHFSIYAVGYNNVSFKDVAANEWYSGAVSFIAARGITTGTGEGNYSPEAKLTRAEFLVMMMRAYGISQDANPADNFADAGNAYYTGYLAAAKRLGITVGTGDNMFAPEEEITRQEMFTLLYKILKQLDELPTIAEGKTLESYSDSNEIAPWAKDAMALFVGTETISGNGGKLSPANVTNRAEIAQVLYNLLSK